MVRSRQSSQGERDYHRTAPCSAADILVCVAVGEAVYIYLFGGVSMGAVKRTHPAAILRQQVRRGIIKTYQECGWKSYPKPKRPLKKDKLKRLYPNPIAPERQMKEFHKQIRQLGKTMSLSELAIKIAAQQIKKTSEALTEFVQSMKAEE